MKRLSKTDALDLVMNGGHVIHVRDTGRHDRYGRTHYSYVVTAHGDGDDNSYVDAGWITSAYFDALVRCEIVKETDRFLWGYYGFNDGTGYYYHEYVRANSL